MADRDHFSRDFLTSRDRFRRGAEAAGAEQEALVLRALGPDGHPLTIDVAWLGPRDARRIVAVSSATHGVEGFMGAAVQLQLLADLPPVPDDAALVLIHAINPYGFAFVRRVNEDNVDLNRNFLREGEAYMGSPEGYAALDPLLNPPRPPSRAGVVPFLVRAAAQIARLGLSTLKGVVAGGQYAYPKGVFFGGGGRSNSMELLEEAVPRWFADAERVLLVDFHTGLGARGTYKLLIDPSPRAGSLASHFGHDVVQPWADDSVAYEIRGGLGTWAASVLPDVAIDVLAAEFGTVNVLRVITALCMENRAHHWGQPGQASTKWAKSLLMEAFAPAESRWRDTVVARGRGIVDRALEAAWS